MFLSFYLFIPYRTSDVNITSFKFPPIYRGLIKCVVMRLVFQLIFKKFFSEILVTSFAPCFFLKLFARIIIRLALTKWFSKSAGSSISLQLSHFYLSFVLSECPSVLKCFENLLLWIFVDIRRNLSLRTLYLNFVVPFILEKFYWYKFMKSHFSQ